MTKILLIISCLLFCTAAVADQNDERLDDLFKQLQEAENQVQAWPLEQRIWSIWIEHDNPQYQQLMLTGIAQMNSNNLQAALQTYNRLIGLAPDYAEAWNKRATIHYLLGNYQASEADIDETLKLEPWHFGALSGLGLVCLAQQDYLRARTAFSSVLEINPSMQSARDSLQAIMEFLQRNTI